MLPKVAELSKEFTNFLQGDEAQKAINDFAKALPGVIDQAVTFGKSIPWDTIKHRSSGWPPGPRRCWTPSSALPPWVQTAVLTGWGLNKLTGGALGGIVGTLAKAPFGAPWWHPVHAVVCRGGRAARGGATGHLLGAASLGRGGSPGGRIGTIVGHNRATSRWGSWT